MSASLHVNCQIRDCTRVSTSTYHLLCIKLERTFPQYLIHSELSCDDWQGSMINLDWETVKTQHDNT